jgi:hypothetical protein
MKKIITLLAIAVCMTFFAGCHAHGSLRAGNLRMHVHPAGYASYECHWVDLGRGRKVKRCSWRAR